MSRLLEKGNMSSKIDARENSSIGNYGKNIELSLLGDKNKNDEHILEL